MTFKVPILSYCKLLLYYCIVNVKGAHNTSPRTPVTTLPVACVGAEDPARRCELPGARALLRLNSCSLHKS